MSDVAQHKDDYADYGSRRVAPSASYLLALDHGTTSSRAILFDHDRQVVALAQKEGALSYPAPGWVEQDAMGVWLDTMAVMAQVMNESGIDPAAICAIGISNQRETCLLWDRKTGLPVGPAIVWQSRQTADICDRWKAQGLEPLVRQRTGLRIDPYFSASKILWMLENLPGVRERAQAGELLFGTMDTWLVWKLTGGRVHATDPSNASRTLLCNIETAAWDPELLEAFGIPGQILPDILPTSAVRGTTAQWAFFGAEVPIGSCVGDQQAALFGQLCLEPGMTKNTYGTGGFLLMNTGDAIVRSEQGLLSTIAWQIGDTVTYALEGSIFVSGALMKWLRDSLHLFDDVEDSCAIAQEAGSSGGVYVVPAFTGLATPYWDARATASIEGLTFSTGSGHIVRAALEAMAYQVKDVLEVMERESCIKIGTLKVDGGAAVNDFLLQFQSDLCGIAVERFCVHELTALGAAFLAGLAVGFWDWDDLAIQVDRRFEPQRPAQVMDQAYAGWRCAVEACRVFKPSGDTVA